MKAFRLTKKLEIRLYPKRPDQGLGETFYVFYDGIHTYLEYDLEGDILFMWSNRNRSEKEIICKCLPLSKVWKRHG